MTEEKREEICMIYNQTVREIGDRFDAARRELSDRFELDVKALRDAADADVVKAEREKQLALWNIA